MPHTRQHQQQHIPLFLTEVELVKAEDGKGMGTWVYRFGKDATEGATAVKLNVYR